MVRTRCCSSCWRTGVPPTWLVICGCLLVQLGFGLYPVVVKKFAASGERKANPVVFSFYRDACCFPLIFLCSLIAERKLLIPRPKSVFVFILLGFTIFASQLMYILGVYWVGPDAVSAFQPITPVWTVILAVLSCTEKWPSPIHLHSWGKLVGILLAAGGAIELALTGIDDEVDINHTTVNINHTTVNVTAGSHSVGWKVGGYVALLAGTFSSATYVLLQKRLIFNNESCRWRDYPVAVTAYSYFFGAVFMGLSTIYFAASGQTSDFIIPQTSVVALVYAIFVASSLCYILLTWTNMHLSSTLVTTFWPLQVLVTVLASYFITGDKLSPYQYIGAAMLIVALLLVLLANHMEERLSEGKSAVRLDDCCRRRSQDTREQQDEYTTLLDSSNMRTNQYSEVSTTDCRVSIVKTLHIN